jgi:hypothetical protein
LGASGVTEARRRLAELARLAGYSHDALEQLAVAVLPGFCPGARLDDNGVRAMCHAVEVCAQAGLDAPMLLTAVETYRRRYGDDWRERFCRSQITIASLRFNRPEVFGPSPCDAASSGDGRPRTPSVRAVPPVGPLDIHPAVAAAPLLAGLRAA